MRSSSMIAKTTISSPQQLHSAALQSARPVAAEEGFEANALIVAIAERRDKAAFAALFGFYAPRLKTMLLRQGFEPTIAEDIVQDTMVALWNKAGSFDAAKAKASAWIFTICRNLGIDRRRRDSRLVHMSQPVGEDVKCVLPLADDIIIAQSDRAGLSNALTQLPDEQAKVISLFFFSDNPHSEIAKTLNIPLGTVKSRLRLALDRLRQLMDRPS